MGFDPEHCWVIEDSAHGVRAAVAAGMRVFGYAARGSADELRAAGAEPFAGMQQFARSITAASMDGKS